MDCLLASQALLKLILITRRAAIIVILAFACMLIGMQEGRAQDESHGTNSHQSLYSSALQSLTELANLPNKPEHSQELKRSWIEFQQTLYAESIDPQALLSLRHSALNAGYRNLPEYSLELLHLAQQSAGASSREYTAYLFRAAQMLSPDLPYPHIVHASYLWDAAEWDFATIVRVTKNLLATTTYWLDERVTLYYQTLLYVMAALALSILLFALVLGVRYLSVMTHEFARIMPGRFTHNQVLILLVTFIAVPGLLLKTPIISICLFLIASAMFQRVGERVLSAIIIVLFAVLPWAESSLRLLEAFPESSAQELLYAQYIGCNDICIDNLKHELELTETTNPLVLYTYLYAVFREHESDAFDLISTKLRFAQLRNEHDSWPDEVHAKILNLHGTTIFLTEEPQRAIPLFEKARTIVPSLLSTSFNLWRAHQSLGQDAKADAIFNQATRINLAGFVAYTEIENPTLHSLAMLEPLSGSAIWASHRTSNASHHPVSRLQVISAHEHVVALLFLLIVFITAVLIGYYRQLRGKVGSVCKHCFHARPPRKVTPPLLRANLCWGCSLDPFNSSNARISERHVSYAKRHRFRKVAIKVAGLFLAIFVPGAIFLWHGAAGVGFGVAFGAAISAVVAFYPSESWLQTGAFTGGVLWNVVASWSWLGIIAAYCISLVATLYNLWTVDE